MSRGLARREDPKTSHEAAEKINASSLEACVLRCLRDEPQGLIVDEIADRLEVRDKSISPRMKPLESRALIFRNGVKKNSRDRNQIVWIHWTLLTEEERARRFKAIANRKPTARLLLARVREYLHEGQEIPIGLRSSIDDLFKSRRRKS